MAGFIYEILTYPAVYCTSLWDFFSFLYSEDSDIRSNKLRCFLCQYICKTPLSLYSAATYVRTYSARPDKLRKHANPDQSVQRGCTNNGSRLWDLIPRIKKKKGERRRKRSRSKMNSRRRRRNRRRRRTRRSFRYRSNQESNTTIFFIYINFFFS